MKGIVNAVANILWIIFGGLILSVAWALVGIISCLTIVGIPFGTQCFKFANLMLFPFGREVEYSGSTASVLLNILWIIFIGVDLAVCSLVIGALWCLTIVGIPIGLQAFKFAKLSLLPFEARIV